MPILTQAAAAQIILDKNKLIAISPTTDKLFISGENPVVEMEMEATGIEAAVQIIDKNTGHSLAALQYTRDNETLLIALMNRTSGAWRTLLELKPDGTATIGNGMTQHQIATDADLGEVMNTLIGKIINKAIKLHCLQSIVANQNH